MYNIVFLVHACITLYVMWLVIALSSLWVGCALCTILFRVILYDVGYVDQIQAI